MNNTGCITYVFYLLFSFQGRIPRIHFLSAQIPVSMLWVALLLLSETDSAFFFISVLVLFSWISLAVATKRWHDRGKSGWWTLVTLVPYIGLLWYLVELTFLRGTPGPNEYGEEPTQLGDGNQCNPASGKASDATPLNEVFMDLVALLAKMAKSDGHVHQKEIDLVDEFFQSHASDFRIDAIEAFRQYKDSDTTFEWHARRMLSKTYGDLELHNEVVFLLFSVALADGVMSSEEEFLLNQAITIFGVACEDYDRYRSDRQYEEAHSSNDRRQFEEILGVNAYATPDQVRAAYVNLAKQYHPDKVAHLGPRLRQVAEEEMKRINEAYQYLRSN